MINPPTDRLHKFISLAGIALILLSINIATTKYHETKLQNIEAEAAVERMVYAQQEFARGVNELLEIERRAKEAGFESWKTSGYKEQFDRLNPEVERLRKEMHISFLESTKPISQAIHLEHMRNIWFALSGAAFVLGLILALSGFKTWLKQPQKER